jgi:hypothetical protein
MPYKVGNGPPIEDVYKSNNVFANNVPVALHLPPGTVEGGVYIPVDDFVFDSFHAAAVLADAGLNAPFDDENAFDGGNFDGASVYPFAESSLPTEVLGAAEDIPPRTESDGIPIECGEASDPVNYDQNLSPNFTIRSLSVGAHFPHRVAAQGGLSIQDIICNMQALAVNILEPLSEKYPGFRINSGFRIGSGTSQHGRGQGVDLQWPGLAPAGYNEIAVWCIANLPFDQFIFEHGNSIWIHMSYNRAGRRTGPNAILTYYPRAQPNYKTGLTNYYAPSAPFPPPEEV